MYSFWTRSRRAEKQFYAVLDRPGVRKRLSSLSKDPRTNSGAHPLRGKLQGKWSCVLGPGLRLVYEIDDENQRIIVVAAGSHNTAYR